MKKVAHNIAKILFALILAMPILGATGIFPPPTPEMYSNPKAYEFIHSMMEGKYITIIMAIVHLAAIYYLFTKRTGLSAILVAPITVNIVAFHAFLDGGLFTGGAVMGNILLVLNAYFLWYSKDQLKTLLQKTV